MRAKNAVCYSLSPSLQDVLAHLRLIGPLQSAGINVIDGMANKKSVYEYITQADVVVIQRDFPGKFEDYQKIVEIAKQEGKPIIFDLDDLLFFLPKKHPARQSQYYVPSLLPMFQALGDANLVTVSTPKLKSVLDNYHDNVIVLPNYFDETLWQLQPPILEDTSNKMIVIGYVGGNTHDADLEYIAPALSELTRRYPNEVRLHFWGAELPEKLQSLSKVTRTQNYYRSYKDFVKFFQSQSADIFIAPLSDNLFNRCKSPIKFFDYTALGTPGVFSRLEPYTQVVDHGKNGLLAESPDEWLDCIVQLIEDHELGFQLATNAQETVRSNWLLSKNAFRWQEAFHDLAVPPITSIHRENEVNIIQSINIQLAEMWSKHQVEVDMNSKAWRMVRFLQRLRAWLAPPGSWRAQIAGKIHSFLCFFFSNRSSE